MYYLTLWKTWGVLYLLDTWNVWYSANFWRTCSISLNFLFTYFANNLVSKTYTHLAGEWAGWVRSACHGWRVIMLCVMSSYQLPSSSLAAPGPAKLLRRQICTARAQVWSVPRVQGTRGCPALLAHLDIKARIIYIKVKNRDNNIIINYNYVCMY